MQYAFEKRIYDAVRNRRVKRMAHGMAKGLGARHLYIRMDLNNSCNLRCRMCFLTKPEISKLPKEEMPTWLLNKIAADLFPRTKYLYLSCVYEPLIAKQFDRAIELARRYGVTHTSAYSNGMELSEEKARRMIDAQMAEISVSIDSHTEERMKYYRGADLPRITHNIRTLNDLKRRAGSARPVLRINFTMMRGNVEDIPGALRLARELDVRIVHLRHAIDFDCMEDFQRESLLNHKELANRMLDEGRALAKDLGIFLDAPPNFDMSTEADRNAMEFKPSMTQSQCFYPWFLLVVDCQGRVRPCSYWRDGFLGNLQQSTFDEIYEKQYRPLQERLLSGNLPASCQTCPPCGGDKAVDRGTNRVDQWQEKEPIIVF